MAATMIQASVIHQPVTVRRPAISALVLGAIVSVAFAAALLIAMLPGLARVPAAVDQPRALEAPVTASVESVLSDGTLSKVGVAEPEPGPHPSR